MARTSASPEAPEAPPAAGAPAPVITCAGLTVESVQGDGLVEIYQSADLTLHAGEVVLLVGPSGSGKSLFTKLLAGLLGRGTDTLRIGEGSRLSVHLKDGSRHEALETARYPKALRGAIGYMFQHHALFDELTVEENIRIGNDLARRPLRGAALKDWLYAQCRRLRLERLLQSPIEPLSGGQRQRVSLLRMLALHPEVLVFDEPTSGLDSDSARRVAELIREVQHQGDEADRPRLSLVVTHDYANLLQAADRVVLLDPRRAFTVFETRTEAAREQAREAIEEALRAYEPPRPRAHDRRACQRVKRDAEWHRFTSAPGRSLDALVTMPGRLLRTWRWHARFFLSLFRLLVIDAMPFVLVSGLAVGLVLSYFSLNAVPQHLQSQAEPVFIEEMIKGLGLGLWQIIAPLFTAICLAARSGAAVAGHVASLERSSQLDALRVLGMPPGALFADKVMASFAIGLPILTAICFVAASAACLVVVLMTRPLATWWTFVASFFDGLGSGPLDLPYYRTDWILAKLVPAGLLTGWIAWSLGAAPKETSEDVNRAITRAIMRGILCVIAVFFCVLLVEIRNR